MMPALQAEEAMADAERMLVGRFLKPEYVEEVYQRWLVAMNHGDTPRRRKAPPIPREFLGAMGMGYEEVPPRE